MLLAQQQSSAEPLTQGIADRRNQPQTPGQDGCLGTSIANSHLCKRGPNPLAVRISASHFNPTVWSGKGGKMENYSRHSGQGILKGALLGTRQGYQNEDWHAGKSKADSSWSALLRVWLHELEAARHPLSPKSFPRPCDQPLWERENADSPGSPLACLPFWGYRATHRLVCFQMPCFLRVIHFSPNVCLHTIPTHP